MTFVSSLEQWPQASPEAARFEIRHWDGKVETTTLPLGHHDIGRTEGDIVFPQDRNVSRLHAQLEVAQGRVRYVDMGSTCGSFTASGQRIHGALLLKAGDSVLLGNGVLTVLSVASGGLSSLGTAVTHQEMSAVNLEDWDPDWDV